MRTKCASCLLGCPGTVQQQGGVPGCGAHLCTRVRKPSPCSTLLATASTALPIAPTRSVSGLMLLLAMLPLVMWRSLLAQRLLSCTPMPCRKARVSWGNKSFLQQVSGQAGIQLLRKVQGPALPTAEEV